MVLTRADEPSVEYLAFKLYAEEDLEKAEAYFRAKGLPVEYVERAYQSKTLRTRDNLGVPIEFFVSMDKLEPIHQKYELYRGVKPLRIDHFNIFSTNVDESAAFYNDFGFRVTEYTEDEETGRMWAAWMHRKGGVHDMAFTNGLGPRLHHVAFWVPTPLNIIDLLDLMSTTGYLSNIERGPGRHGISNAFFLYIRDPDNHRVEIYCSDYLTVDPDLDQLTNREREVLRLLARGYAYKEIARELMISVKTVETHASAVLRKLQLSNRSELSRWASERRLI